MKLEKYIKVDGALKTPKYKEVQEEDIPSSKGIRGITVDSITITVTLESGAVEVFQGDEVSQDRLHRAYTVLKDKNVPHIPWKTVDNKQVLITANDALEILYLAGLQQSSVWF